MNIEIRLGSVLDSDAPVIAHQVNCHGVMGAGVANAIKEKYPDVYHEYKEFCSVKAYSAERLLGRVNFARSGTDGKIIANMFGQDNFGTDAVQTNYAALELCLCKLALYLRENGIKRVAMPYLIGCGLAGGDRTVVMELIRKQLCDADVTLELACLEPRSDLFGAGAVVNLDHIEDGIASGEWQGISFTAPECFFFDRR